MILNKTITKAIERPIKVLQYGEGNFLRGFVDEMIDIANEKGVFDGNILVVKPISFGNLEAFQRQDNQYTLLLRGMENGEKEERVRCITSIGDAVDCIEDYESYEKYYTLDTLRFIVSNTTEAGIVFDETDVYEAKPPKTYPGKLTKLLHKRYEHYKGDSSKGLIIIPCELIENNGPALKKCVLQYSELWGLGEAFTHWIEDSCIFCSTLVDRIVTGYPRDEVQSLYEQLGYEDALLDTGELFALWVIESEKPINEELPLDQAGLPVIFTDNQKPYRERKVRILNGAHTSFVLASYLAGNDTVGESMSDAEIREFMKQTIFDEIIPTLTLPKQELLDFAHAVIERFENPFIRHALLSISLNSVSKWKARCLPSFKEYVQQYDKLPEHLTFSLAALLLFYKSNEKRNGVLIGKRGSDEYSIQDDEAVLEFFAAHSELPTREYVEKFLSNTKFLGEDLTIYNGLVDKISTYINEVEMNGIREVIAHINQ